jgi:hypothetical protein
MPLRAGDSEPPPGVSRRTFLSGLGAAAAFGSTLGFRSATAGTPPSRIVGRRPRIAALTTIFHKYSHSEHIIDRFLEGYGWEGRHHRPAMDVVSLYVEQVGDNDLSRERASRHPELRIYPTIAEALTCGGSDLAVDGVLLIGEHGKYPVNEMGQMLYPRYEYFRQVVEVYRRSGRTAPVFNDKHLSWSWPKAREMYDLARELGFPLMAGSSLPVTWRQPAVDLPRGARVEEVVGVWNGWLDGGDFHVLEALQSVMERRRGGETGVRWVEALRGERFWTALESESWEAGGWDRGLLEAALSRSNQLSPARETYSHVFPTVADLRRMAPDSYAYRFEYADGLRATIVQFRGGVVGDCNVAARLRGGDVFSVQFYLPYSTMRNFFSPLVHHLENMFLTGRASYPVERTLLTTGLTAAGVESLFREGRRMETPHLAIRYQPTRHSTFWRT